MALDYLLTPATDTPELGVYVDTDPQLLSNPSTNQINM